MKRRAARRTKGNATKRAPIKTDLERAMIGLLVARIALYSAMLEKLGGAR